ncbi:MAG: CRISPR system precrRNA processing endoribonuclease RAMP protein Cas6 [Methanocellales archaeon]
MMMLSNYEIKIRFNSKAELPQWKGSTFRGALGQCLRRSCCINLDLNCKFCLLRSKCAYYYIYETSPQSSSTVLRKLQDVPRPFVLEPPNVAKTEFTAGEEVEMNLILFGRGNDYLPYFIVALRNLGEIGIGKKRRFKYGRFTIDSIYVTNLKGRDCIYNNDGFVYNKQRTMGLNDFYENREVDCVKVVFTTPTQLKSGGEYISELDFYTLMRSLLWRYSAIAYFHCGETISEEFVNKILENADKVELESYKINIIEELERYSTRRGKMKMPLSFVGEFCYRGKIDRESLALLKLGQYLHIGKMTPFGCGKYEVII